jgi:hypothetical protein
MGDDSTDLIVVGGQSAGPAPVITGTAPPSALASWWPYILAAGVLGLVWWFVRKDREVGRGLRPLAG